MSIDIQWMDNRQTQILLKFKRGWTWAALTDAIREADDRISSVTQTVHLLLDLTEAGRPPLDFIKVAGDLFSSGDARPNEGLRIIIGASWLLRSAYNTLSKVYGAKLAERPILFADSMSQAQELLLAQP